MLKGMRKFMQTPCAFPFLISCFASLPPLLRYSYRAELTLQLIPDSALSHSHSCSLAAPRLKSPSCNCRNLEEACGKQRRMSICISMGLIPLFPPHEATTRGNNSYSHGTWRNGFDVRLHKASDGPAVTVAARSLAGICRPSHSVGEG